MRAARIHRFGGPEVIELEDLPEPEPGVGEVRIRIAAASINPVDYKIRQGGFVAEDKLPIALGRDVAGVVDRLGAEPGPHLKVGDRVFAMLPQDRGGCADFVAVKPEICALTPDRLDDVSAGALGVAALTAWQGLVDHGGLREGQRVLIHGAAGGVGHLAVQFAVARGAEVYATCSRNDIDFVRGLGAAFVIDYHTERFEDHAHDIDLVHDLIAGETQDRSWAVLRRGGIIVSTVAEPDREKAARHGARGTHYMARPDGAQLAEIAALIDDGKVTPTVSRIMTLSEIAEAHRVLEQGHVRGKLVLRVPG